MLVDVSHVVEHGMITYKGLPAPLVCDFLSREQSWSHYAPGTEFHIGKIEMVANTGTYLDSPFHRYANGRDLSELPLERLANLQGVVIPADLSKGRAIGRTAFKGHDLRGKAVLVRTGWDAHWRTDQYFEGHPFLTREAAEYLLEAGVALVGIDSLNIDDTADLTRPVRSPLLAGEVPIVEHLVGFTGLPGTGFRFFAVPAKIKGMGTFPVRAFGLLEGNRMTADELAAAVGDAAAHELEIALNRIKHCLGQLNDDQVWHRSQPSLNSVGNLILHLCGNLRQWVVAGLGGAPDVRNRPTEFAEQGPIPKKELLRRLETVVEEAKRILTGVDARQLTEVRRIQGFDVTGLAAVFDSVPHFRGHTQEIVHMTRLQLGDAYGFAWSPTTPEQGAPV